MSEEIIETTVRVDKATAEWHEGLLKKSKKELRDIVINTLLEKTLRDKDLDEAQQKAEALQTKLDKARFLIEQSRRMIISVVDIWDDGV